MADETDFNNLDIDIANIGKFANDPAGNVNPREGAPYKNIRKVIADAEANLAGVDIGASAAALINQKMKFGRAYVTGKISSLVWTNDTDAATPTVSLDEGLLYEENNSGNPKATIAPLTGVVLGQGEAVIVDFDTGSLDGSGRYIPVKVSLAAANQTGWQTGRRYVLIAKAHNKRVLFGEYRIMQEFPIAVPGIIAAPSNGITLDTVAKTLTLTSYRVYIGSRVTAGSTVTLSYGSIGTTQAALVYDRTTNTFSFIAQDTGLLAQSQVIIAILRTDTGYFTSGIFAYTRDGQTLDAAQIPRNQTSIEALTQAIGRRKVILNEKITKGLRGALFSLYLKAGQTVSIKATAVGGDTTVNMYGIGISSEETAGGGSIASGATREQIYTPTMDIKGIQLLYSSASTAVSANIEITLPDDVDLRYVLDSALFQVERGGDYNLVTVAGALSPLGGTPLVADYLRTSRSVLAGTHMLELKPNESYEYSGIIDVANIAGVVYVSSAGAIVGNQFTALATYVNAPLIPPAGAAWVAFCGKGGFTVQKAQKVIKPQYLNLITPSRDIFLDNTAPSGGTGSYASPVNSLASAIALAASTTRARIVATKDGDYRETLPLHLLPSGDFSFVNIEGKSVRILGSDKLGPWTKTAGRANIYQTPFSGVIPNWTRYANPIFEDGRPSKPILPAERHPLQRNLTHRLPFTPITQVASLDICDGTPGTYIVSEGTLYIHTSDSDNPASNGFSYENIARSANTSNVPNTTTKQVSLMLKNLLFRFSTAGLVLRGFAETRLSNISALATTSAGSICPDSGMNELFNCEAGFSNGDSFNGHFSAYGGFADLLNNRTNFPTTKYEACWGHDSFDDGESSHEHHNVIMDKMLLEYNGDSGCRPSNDATYMVSHSVFRYNGWEVGYGGVASKGEGFSVVNPTSGGSRIGCRARLIGCLSYGNNTGYGNITSQDNWIELENCTSRDNFMAEYYSGAGEMVVRNSRATNADPAKLKVTSGTGVITVKNDPLLV